MSKARVRPYVITCNSGMWMSIAANPGLAYSTAVLAPPEDKDPVHYTHVEIYGPRGGVGPTLEKYFPKPPADLSEDEYREFCNDGIRPYVPMEIVLQLVAENGGIKEGELPPHKPRQLTTG